MFSIDVAAYDNRYDDLRSQEFPTPPGIPIVLMNMLNARHARRRDHVARRSWRRGGRSRGGYTHLWKEFTFDPGSTDRTGGASEANDPRHLFKLRSYINAGTASRFDAFFRYVGALPHRPSTPTAELDAPRRLSRASRVGPGAHRHQPALAAAISSSAPARRRKLYERAVTLRSTWRF